MAAILSHDRVGREGLTILVRRAVENDVEGIVTVKQAVWPQEAVNPDYVAANVRNSEHTTLVAVQASKVVGFVDGFMTLSAAGIQRWEVDLLAVHPAYRGQGIAARLVVANTDAGKAVGAVGARALIGAENTASQRTFVRCGYIKSFGMYALYVGAGSAQTLPACDAHLIPVSTMNYVGVWVEGALSASSFVAARALGAHRQWDIAGVVIPTNSYGSIQAAQEAGYSLVGYYVWWLLDLDKP